MAEITSRDNQKLKQFRRIRDGLDADSVFLEGVRLAHEAFRSEIRVTAVVLSASFGREAEFPGIREPMVLPDRLFDSVSDTKRSQGIVLIADRPETGRDRFTERYSGSTSLFLNRINNPSNLGAILRTCEAAGINDVIVSRNSSDAFSPKALRASMGSALRLNIWEDSEFSEAINWARAAGLRTTAADVSGTLDFRALDWQPKRLLVFGSEAHGLSPAEISSMDDVIVIPMHNGVESLNLAVSAGIILFERLRDVVHVPPRPAG